MLACSESESVTVENTVRNGLSSQLQVTHIQIWQGPSSACPKLPFQSTPRRASRISRTTPTASPKRPWKRQGSGSSGISSLSCATHCRHGKSLRHKVRNPVHLTPLVCICAYAVRLSAQDLEVADGYDTNRYVVFEIYLSIGSYTNSTVAHPVLPLASR